MPGIEIKGRSKRANYSHGGKAGKKVVAGEPPEQPVPPKTPKAKRRSDKKEGGKVFPDHSGDGKITQKDILMAKGVIPKSKGKK